MRSERSGTGFRNVALNQRGKYQATIQVDGKQRKQSFMTPEEAALCVARSFGAAGAAAQAAEARVTAARPRPPPMTRSEALAAAAAEGITLLSSSSGTGFNLDEEEEEAAAVALASTHVHPPEEEVLVLPGGALIDTRSAVEVLEVPMEIISAADAQGLIHVQATEVARGTEGVQEGTMPAVPPTSPLALPPMPAVPSPMLPGRDLGAKDKSFPSDMACKIRRNIA